MTLTVVFAGKNVCGCAVANAGELIGISKVDVAGLLEVVALVVLFIDSYASVEPDEVVDVLNEIWVVLCA